MEFFLPTVLRSGAPMPPAGRSGLPESLERVVPEQFRYWTVRGEEARQRREQLIKSRFFTRDNVALVNGELRKVEIKLYDPGVLHTEVVGEGSTAGLERMFDKIMPICKSVEDERYFLAVVLEPRTAVNPDLQKEYYTAKAIREGMYTFMEYVAKGLKGSREYGAGIEHARDLLQNPITTNDQLTLVENYIAPVDFSLIDPSGVPQQVMKDTWLQGWRASPQLWPDIKAGVYKGLSIDGFSMKRRRPRVTT